MPANKNKKSITKATSKKTAPNNVKAPEVTVIPEVLDKEPGGLLPYNPLLQNQVITVNDETEQRVQMITEIESLAEINKQQLAVRRERVALEVENKKLDAAKKTIDSIDKIINAVSDEKVLERVTKNINTPMDMKMMAEAAERLTNTLKNLMNPNVADAAGNKKQLKVNAMFKNSSTGDLSGFSVSVDMLND